MGRLQCVIFSPEDLLLIKEGPAFRRRFLDMLISQIEPAYFTALQLYQRALDQRNALLREEKRSGRMDTVLLAIRSLFLMTRKELCHAKTHNPITRISSAIAEGLHKIGLVPAKLIHPRAPDDERYGTYLTNAISFGLLLTAAGIVVGMLYVFIRMGH